jgi:hypothetical protein
MYRNSWNMVMLTPKHLTLVSVEVSGLVNILKREGPPGRPENHIAMIPIVDVNMMNEANTGTKESRIFRERLKFGFTNM